ncbi:MAG: glucose-1-phosphate thymidylyltransferase [Verrucomicrobiales bacterium]|jgi:glucose-1-phosphate thymidylyltransferase
MNLVILCAGYAQRLQGIGNGVPKALLPVRGRPMLDHVLEKMGTHPALKTVSVITNAAHFSAFEDWMATSPEVKRLHIPLAVLNDGSLSCEDKLGAIGDLGWAIQEANLEQNDLAVVAGDTLFSSSQQQFIEKSLGKPCTIGTFDTRDVEVVKRIASITTATDGRILHFEEKPKSPRSTVGGIALYCFRSDCLPLIRQYLAEGNNPDQAGHLIAWLSKRVKTYGIPIDGDWIDIGSPDSYRFAESNGQSGESNRL